MYQYKAKLMSTVDASIYDADTIKIKVDLGFGIYFNLGSCRLYGIDAPEIRGEERPEGLLARDFVRGTFTSIGDNEFIVNTYKDQGDKYGRYLVEIILPDGTNLNTKLIELGYATTY